MIYVKMLRENSVGPKRSTQESAGNDIFAPEDLLLQPKEVKEIELPFVFEGELEKYRATVYVRSSFGMKKKQRMVNEQNEKNIVGVSLDLHTATYTIRLLNDSEEVMKIKKGEHFAQIVITKKEEKEQEQKIEWLTEEEKTGNEKKISVKEIKENIYEISLMEDMVFKRNQQIMFPTGIRTVIPKGCYVSVDTHKGIKNSIMLGNQRGIIDCDYAYNESTRGNCFLGLLNITGEEFVLKKGTPIVTFVATEYVKLSGEEAVQTKRTGGVGHTS